MAAISILLIDDDSTILQALAAKLSASPDVETQATADPAKAVALAKEFQPDLIVCDVNMPGLGGREVAAAIRRTPATGTIPLVFLTTLVDAEHIARDGSVAGLAPV